MYSLCWSQLPPVSQHTELTDGMQKKENERCFGSLMELKPANQHDSTDLWQCHVCA